MLRLLNTVMGLVAGFLLNCAVLASAALLFGVRKVAWYNPFSWGIPLHWNWDTIMRALAVGLPIWIVCFTAKCLHKGVTFQVFQSSSLPLSNMNGAAYGSFDRQSNPDFAAHRIVQPERMSLIDVARTHNFDFAGRPDLARLIADSGAYAHMSASQRQALTNSLDRQSDPSSN